MTGPPPTLPRERRLTRPRAAGFAGIVFGVLYAASFALLILAIPDQGTSVSEWVEQEGRMLSTSLQLVPFAGIAFLWFMGAVRDRLGREEDQFFSTLFFGSGFIYLTMTFVAAALTAGLLYSSGYNSEGVSSLTPDTYIVARNVVYDVLTVYALRMASMFMFVLGTIWLRTGLMPRWLAIITYISAAVLLITVGFTLWIIMIFPLWVFFVSLLGVIFNRSIQEQAALGQA